MINYSNLVGKKIKLLNMVDPFPLKRGLIGKITNFEKPNTLYVNWNNGSTLKIFIGIDEFEILE
ncbi:DUF4314 domain-containing protein [Streptococcus lutetiensis]|uniref:DUF4314 domain-containing protein n=1 Tax=Streptococcus lutetiensis TaxID=150055 RepID=UPI001C11A49D|nr:DUF4314 domain-containing protein [Streptococcus lutetiensis]MBU5320077.1 DUF4314 domain-containing protein [Streptococcus lutetiensis]